MEPPRACWYRKVRNGNIHVLNTSYGTLNIEVATGEGKEYLRVFLLFETELNVTAHKTFAVKS
jgi:S-adenosylmethionine hydrolase